MAIATLTTPVMGMTDEELLDEARKELSEAKKLYPHRHRLIKIAYHRYNAAFLRVYPWLRKKR